jgi:hypothetical protein
MGALKPASTDKDIVVNILNGTRRPSQVVIRNTKERITLGGKSYDKYQIIRPRGYEKEEVFHRPGRGYEALLSVVFTALAEASKRKLSYQRQR